MAPGFEKLALQELIKYFKQNSIEWDEAHEIHPGGIEVSLPFAIGCSLNQWLRIPTRILWRRGSKKDLLMYQDFQKWLRSLGLHKIVPFGKVHVSTRSSKLKMKDKLKKVFLNTFQYNTSEQGADVYIRFFRDECTVSLDTSGADLYRRGQEKWTGDAPLRETMAAGLLQFATQDLEDMRAWTLVDPMMGSGTFLLEGAQYGQSLNRAFVYQQWSISPKKFPDGANPKDLAQIPRKGFRNLVGRDKDESCVDLVTKNMTLFNDIQCDLRQEDIFAQVQSSSEKVAQPTSPVLVMVNPPYGKRLKLDRKDYYTELVNSIILKYQPERLGLILPRGKSFSKHHDYVQLRTLPFSNNGIDVVFYLLARNSHH